MTNRINDKFDQIKTCSLVITPKSKPKIAGANAEFGPSEIVGVTRIAKAIIHRIPPIGLGKRDIKRYQHHKGIIFNAVQCNKGAKRKQFHNRKNEENPGGNGSEPQL